MERKLKLQFFQLEEILCKYLSRSVFKYSYFKLFAKCQFVFLCVSHGYVLYQARGAQVSMSVIIIKGLLKSLENYELIRCFMKHARNM